MLYSRRCDVRFRLIAVFVALVLCVPAAQAQDFGVMNSAETINRGNFKLMANPLFNVGEDDIDDELGVALVAGYGFTDMFDLEGKVGLFDNITLVGADAEFWIARERPVDFSVIAGFHTGRVEGPFDFNGLDFTFLGSGHATPRLEIYGALDLARNFVSNLPDDFDYTTVHLVPGIEYRISDDLDFVAELGLGLNDESANYLSGGIAYYVR
jgi:hypothetical protein